jgi:beta-lysine 5,6-aminomutase alpha subunit
LEKYFYGKVSIDENKIKTAKNIAKSIVDDMDYLMNEYSSVSIERTVARLMGVDNVDDNDKPLPNVLVDHLIENNALNQGVAFYLANAMINHNTDQPK